MPWDDDIDFGLIRSDYEKLKNYCKENLYTREALYEKANTVLYFLLSRLPSMLFLPHPHKASYHQRKYPPSNNHIQKNL